MNRHLASVCQLLPANNFVAARMGLPKSRYRRYAQGEIFHLVLVSFV
jgi:hypothetical protein